MVAWQPSGPKYPRFHLLTIPVIPYAHLTLTSFTTFLFHATKSSCSVENMHRCQSVKDCDSQHIRKLPYESFPLTSMFLLYFTTYITNKARTAWRLPDPSIRNDHNKHGVRIRFLHGLSPCRMIMRSINNTHHTLFVPVIPTTRGLTAQCFAVVLLLFCISIP